MKGPRFLLDEDSICFGCQNFKAVEDLDYEVDTADVLCGGYCDCPIICFDGNQNKYHEI